MTVAVIADFKYNGLYFTIFATNSESHPFYFRAEDGSSSASLKISFDKYCSPRLQDHKLFCHLLDLGGQGLPGPETYLAFRNKLESLSTVDCSLDDSGRLTYSYKN